MKTKIYLLPGTMCDERLWSRLIPYFNESYELIHVPIPQYHCFSDMADALLEVLPDEKINLFGFSLGGYLASMYALKYPERVARAFLCASSPRAYPPDERRIRENGLNYIHNNGFRELSDDKIRALLDPSNHQDAEIFTVLKEMYNDLGIRNLTYQLEASLKRENLLMELSTLNIPMTFFFSREDSLVKRSWLNILKRQKKDATFIDFDGASHMMPLEKPEELSQEMKRWVSAS